MDGPKAAIATSPNIRLRDRDQRIEGAAERGVDPAAGDRGQHAERAAGHAGEQGRGKRDADGVACAQDDAAQHVAAEIVSAQREGAAEIAEYVGVDHGSDIIGREPRPKQRNGDPNSTISAPIAAPNLMRAGVCARRRRHPPR